MNNNICKRLMRKIYANTYVRCRNIKYLESEQNLGYGYDTLSHVTHQLTGNSGDTVLSYCVRHTLQYFNDYSWQMFGVRDVVTENDIKKFNETKGLIIGGGGLFLPDSNANSVSGWQWPCSKSQLLDIQVPLILYSVGYNYFRGQKPSEFFIDNLNEVVEKASFIGLRNNGSISAVEKLVRNDLRKKIVFQPCTTTIIRKVFEDIPSKKENRKVAINIAYDRIEQRLGENYQKVLQNIAKAVKDIYLRGYEIYCVAHCSFDLNFCNYLDIEGVPYKAIDGEYWLPKKWFSFYNDMEVVLGMRGHAQMIPFGVNTKIISLGSHDKMKWFLEDIDAVDWYIELNSNIDNLRERITSTFVRIQEEEPDYTNKRLIQQQENMFTITKKNAETIHNILYGGN